MVEILEIYSAFHVAAHLQPAPNAASHTLNYKTLQYAGCTIVRSVNRPLCFWHFYRPNGCQNKLNLLLRCGRKFSSHWKCVWKNVFILWIFLVKCSNIRTNILNYFVVCNTNSGWPISSQSSVQLMPSVGGYVNTNNDTTDVSRMEHVFSTRAANSQPATFPFHSALTS